MTNAIELIDVNKNYGRFALERICFSVPQGSIVGLVGENGAGKSTLIKIILALRKPDSGKVYVFGQEAAALGAREKARIGVVFDEGSFPAHFTVSKIARMLQLAYQNQWDADSWAGYIKKFDLPENEVFSKLSKGMKMKLSIAAALSHHAELLILDEATSGLDPFIRDEIIGILNEFTREENHSILISSHIVTDLEKLCDYIAFLHHGKLLFMDEKDEIMRRYAMFSGSEEEVGALPKSAVVSVRRHKYSVEALIDRTCAPEDLSLHLCSLEDIIIYLSKSEDS